jgi:hypothetical protein
MVCGALLFALGPAGATASGVFTVRDVTVDKSAPAATSARDVALRSGRNAAFNTLLRRLTLKASWPRLPSAGQINPDDYLTGFTITDERTSTTRYIAKITYDFDPEKVRGLLGAYGIAFSETRAKPAVVVPVLLTAKGAMLWQPENTWAQAWRAKALDQALVPLIVPLGDLSDINETAGLDPLAPDWMSLRALAGYYGAARALVVTAKVQGAATGALLDVRLWELSPGSANEERLSFQGADEAAAFNAAIDEIAQSIQERWKRQTAIAGGTESVLRATVHFASLAEWVAIQEQLAQTAVVRGVNVVGLTVDEALVDLRHVGTREQLAVTLAQRDLQLSPRTDGAYDLRASVSLVTGAVGPAADIPTEHDARDRPQPQ